VSDSSLTWDNGRVVMAGPITIATVTPLLKQVDSVLTNGTDGQVVVNCEQITLSDSAVLALLIELHRQSGQKGVTLKVEGLREQLVNLIAIYGVEWILA